MTRASVHLESGERIEFWAQGPGRITIGIRDQTVWQIPALSAVPASYSYHHREASETTFEWDDTVTVFWAYSYVPATVAAVGITMWDFSTAGIMRRHGEELSNWMRCDEERPSLHFSPPKNWMNDPNGLCKIGDTWHVFYQFHPCGNDWGPMHWGHATSKDLFNWLHLPVFLHPEQELWRLGATGGAFSGTAFEGKNGQHVFFYTERLPAYDLFTGYREVQKLAIPDRNTIKAECVTSIIEERPKGVYHDFRDPKVWWDDAAGGYRMVLGASLDGDPAVLLYGSVDLSEWTYLGPLYRAPKEYAEAGARAIECPDFFPLNGKWILLMGFVGLTEASTGRHNLLYALVGNFVNDAFIPESVELQVLDFGTDFYALQSFRAEDRQIAFAWLFNWEYRKTAVSPYSGELSLPRQLCLDERNRLSMRIAEEFETAVRKEILTPDRDDGYAIGKYPFEARLSGPLEGTTIKASDANRLSFELTVRDGMISVRLEQDDGSIRYAARLDTADDIRVIYDAGIVEVFADGGRVCGTRRSYANTSPDHIRISSLAKVTVSALHLAEPIFGA
ncbi:GH32 C-terminal domain-containing protein [Pleomorphomonas koreensis]|uniref:GH32 C-terminal domain-containing protein n=1 Tax=Pleomorphomonas koreensis TaxID=257440 RepID=UPI00069D1ED9|nr:GH32 C-terminal domain-containing protein [Pleomorphomonas koreensis]